MSVLSCQKVTVSVLLLLLTMQAVAGQNYHFSNGWHAGKKRSDDSNGCGFRKDVLIMINKLILDETLRSTRQCQGTPSNLDFAESDSIGTDSDNQLADKRWK